VKYRKVSTAIWVDGRFRAFADDGKLAFLALLTHPAMSSVGAMRGTVAGLAAELGWKVRRLERALVPATTEGMVLVNGAAAFIGLPNFLNHNPPENPNVCKAWASALLALPECPEREATTQRCRDFLARSDSPFPPSFLKAFEEQLRQPFGKHLDQPFQQHSPKSLAIQEQGARSKNKEQEKVLSQNLEVDSVNGANLEPLPEPEEDAIRIMAQAMGITRDEARRRRAAAIARQVASQ
jgi:hypothetical protein